MFQGMLCMLVTGLCWVGIGAIASYNAAHRIDQKQVQFVSSVLAGAFSLVLLLAPGIPIYEPLTALMMIGCGAFNYLTYLALCKSMCGMNNALAWAIMQSAMLFPFLMGILFFGVRLTWLRAGGMALLLAALLLTALRPGPGAGGATVRRGALFLAFAAMVLAGASQCCGNLPSYWSEAASLGSVARCFWCQLGGAVLFLPALAGRREVVQAELRKALPPILALTAGTLLTQYCFFFRGLDLLAEAGAGSLGYPVAIGSCVAGFALYSIFVLKEPVSRTSLAALGGTVAGVVMLSL